MSPHARMSHLIAAATLWCAVASAPVAAQSYPTGPVKLISQAAIGSGPDATARVIADRLSSIWKQQVYVVNRPGAGGLIAARAAAAEPPDGSTLYMPNSSTILVLPVTHAPLPLDLEASFQPVGIVGIGYMMLSVTPSSGITSVADLIARAKAAPGKLDFAAGPPGTLPHISSLLFLEQAGVKMTYVPFTGSAQSQQAALSGSISVVFDGVGPQFGAIEGGQLKPLAVTAPMRLAVLPNVPSMAEFLPGYAADSWQPLMLPAGAPKHIVDAVADGLRAVQADPGVQARFRLFGLEFMRLSPDETAGFIRSEQAKWKPIIARLGVKPGN